MTGEPEVESVRLRKWSRDQGPTSQNIFAKTDDRKTLSKIFKCAHLFICLYYFPNSLTNIVSLSTIKIEKAYMLCLQCEPKIVIAMARC